jgi:STE24 endopeptidase
VGPARRIVLWRTILRPPFDAAERRFVVAHELAHHGRHHIWKAVAWAGLLALPLLALVDLVAPGLRRPDAVPRALFAALVLWLALLPFVSAISRRYETEADWQALRATCDPAAARALFVDFARTALDEPDPPRWAAVLLGDHPTLLRRVELAEAWRRLSRPASRAGS